MFDAMLVTNVVGQAWKEIETEYGADRKIDAKCSFGKGLFGDIVKDVNPSKVRFLENSQVDFTLGFGCSVVVQDESGTWNNFRSVFAELYTKISLDISANDAVRQLKFSGDVKDLKAIRIKIFKKEESMIVEETTLTMMLNLGLGMAKSQAQSLLDIPQIGYPTIKPCTGLTLMTPSINIHDGFIVLSTDLGVKTAEKGCDVMENSEFSVKDVTDQETITREEDNIVEDVEVKEDL